MWLHEVASTMFHSQRAKPIYSSSWLELFRPVFLFCSVQFSSVGQLCLTLCDPMNRSMPGLPVHHQLSNSCPSSRWCHPTISSSVVPFSSFPQSFPASETFQMSQLFASGGHSIGVSASALVLPMNTQYSSLGWTGWISLQSKGLSRVLQHHSSKASILQCSAFFIVQLSHLTVGSSPASRFLRRQVRWSGIRIYLRIVHMDVRVEP